MIAFIIIICTISFIIGVMTNKSDGSEIHLSLLILLFTVGISFFVFCFIKGEEYFKPVYRMGDSVVYRDTSYGRIDSIFYLINEDTIGYGDIQNK